MSILKQIADDLLIAQKAKNEFVLNALRMLNAAIKNAEIALRPKKMEEPEIIEIIAKEMKKLKDSLADFIQAARHDLVEKTEKEIKILEKYLPKMMSEEEIKSAVSKTISDLKATVADFGKVMSALNKELKGKAEGSVIAKLAKELLK